MKRIAFALLAVSLGGALAFGQDAPAPAPAPVAVTIGDWGAQIFAIGNQDSSGYWAGAGTSWGTTQRIVGLNISATYAYGGFSITPDADNGTFGLTDQNKAWVTPLPGLTVESGINLETDTWRGTADWGSDDWLRFQGYQQNSFTFFRLGEDGTGPGGAYETDINYNKDGVGAWVLVSGTNNNTATNGQAQVQDLGSQIQAGAAYTIPSTATIKAQYVGYGVQGTALQGTARASIGDGTPFGQIQVAVNVSPLVKGLNEEVGIDVPSNGTDAGYVFQVSDITDFTVDQVTLHLLALITDFNGNLSSSGGSGIGLLGGVGADYDLGNKVTLQGDLRYGNTLGSTGGASTNGANPLTGILVGIKKGYDHGDIGIGFEYSTSTIGSTVNSPAYGANSNTGDAHWAIPVELHEYF